MPSDQRKTVGDQDSQVATTRMFVDKGVGQPLGSLAFPARLETSIPEGTVRGQLLSSECVCGVRRHLAVLAFNNLPICLL